jgi:hypothetical protein
MKTLFKILIVVVSIMMIIIATSCKEEINQVKEGDIIILKDNGAWGVAKASEIDYLMIMTKLDTGYITYWGEITGINTIDLKYYDK